MVLEKSLDDSIKIIAALLHDVCKTHGAVFNSSALRNTLRKVNRRVEKEGIGFLTKTLPRLGKAFDKALTGHPLDAVSLGFRALPDSKLPRFLGELFKMVLAPDGTVLPTPCAKSVSEIRQILYFLNKYELPYSEELELQVISQFEKTDRDLLAVSERLLDESGYWEELDNYTTNSVEHRAFSSALFEHYYFRNEADRYSVVRRARILLERLFARFDPMDIFPRHGPGAVATKQKLWEKYLWKNVSAKITSVYPLDAYFYASLGHVCDRLQSFQAVGEADLPARVILVPKDSRGPRLISCEPVDYQWIQQGLGRAIVRHVEHVGLTKFNVFFTNQQPNQFGALLGSELGKYATLDLKEASDRVSVGLVHLLFPQALSKCLMACRSSSTVLPDGKEITLSKFAPMGSCLCFPIMALSIWAILTAAAPDADTRAGILVYGDDVIVPTAYATDAITQLESFGLLVNRDKSCTGGLFRESCGTDAFQGVNVTPVRLRTVWETSRSPESYCSWIAYANSFYDRKYFSTYDLIVGWLHSVYGEVPADDMFQTKTRLDKPCPCLREVPDAMRPKRKRTNKGLQKTQWNVWTLKTPAVTKVIDGWSMLLRWFTEKASPNYDDAAEATWDDNPFELSVPRSVSEYTRRRTGMLVRRWR